MEGNHVCLQVPWDNNPEFVKAWAEVCIVWVLVIKKLAMCSPHVRETKTVLDSGFHAVDSGFQISCQWTLDSGFHRKWDSGFIGLNSGFQSTGFQIPGTKICQILGSGWLYMGCNEYVHMRNRLVIFSQLYFFWMVQLFHKLKQILQTPVMHPFYSSFSLNYLLKSLAPVKASLSVSMSLRQLYGSSLFLLPHCNCLLWPVVLPTS